MTDAMSAGRFPADEPLNALGRRQLDASTPLDVVKGGTRALCAPEKRAVQTAELLGLRATVDARLADLDCGRWRGRAVADVPPAELGVWLSEPSHAPHGGESVAGMIDRVAGWLGSLTPGPSRIVAVTHPAVIRAAVVTALQAPPESFWRVDVAPVTRAVLHHRGNAWTLRCGG